MPAKILPDAETFANFTVALFRRGFRRLSPEEFGKDFERLELSAPSPRKGRETGFTFTANGFTVLVWTTFLTRKARNRDAGWVLIKEGDEVKYFSHPMHRTKNFLHNLIWHACIARLRVKNRPLCPKCHAFMDIARGKGLKSRYWQCKRHKAESLPWDYGLPQEALDFLYPQRKQRARYRKKLRAQGKPQGTALKRRRKWKINRPSNIVRA